MALTVNGLEIPRFTQIIEDIESKERKNINPNINTSDDELLGQLNSILAERISRIYQLAQSVNDNFNVDKAEGRNLDDLGELKDVLRLDASKTQGNQNFTGEPNTLVSQGTIVQNPTTEDRYFVNEDLVLSSSEVYSSTFSVAAVENSTDYSLIVDGVLYTYTSDATATLSEILFGLKLQIDNDVNRKVTASIENETITLVVNSGTVSVSSTNNMSLDSVTCQGYIVAEENGPIVAGANSITDIVTPILGLDSTTNPDALTTGRNRETDEEYRIRIKGDSNTGGKATIPAIESALRNTEGVSYAIAVQNNTMLTDADGRPPKSVEVIVQGGTDNLIAETYWTVIGGGIETFGTTTVSFEDEDGDSQEVSFSRPTATNIAVRVTYSKYDEETFPDGGEDSIRQAVVEYCNDLGIGNDVIPKRFYGPIYTSCGGIGELTVEIQEIANSGDAPVGTWQETTLAIPPREYAQTSITDVTIVEV